MRTGERCKNSGSAKRGERERKKDRQTEERNTFQPKNNSELIPGKFIPDLSPGAPGPILKGAPSHGLSNGAGFVDFRWKGLEIGKNNSKIVFLGADSFLGRKV